MILCDGESSRYNPPKTTPASVIATRRENARKAAAVLGVGEPRLLDYPDNRLDTVPLLEITKLIESAISDFGPQTVFTHHAGDMNIDHRLVSHSVLTATRPVPGSSVERVYAFEVLSSSHVGSGQFGRPFIPNTFVDISETIDLKVDAMRCYDGELHAFPHPRSIEAIRALAVTRGIVCGVAAAEAFELIREVKKAHA